MDTSAALEKMAMNKMIAEAKETGVRLSNGSGTVSSCPAHADIAKGVKLCLDLLVCLLTASASPRRTGVYAGAASFIAVAIVEIIRAIIAAHGGDPSVLDSVTSATRGG